MVLLIIVGIITIILSIYFTIDDDSIAGVITFLCGVCVGSLLLLILAFFSSCMPDNEYNFAESENKSIIALQDNIYLQRRNSDLKYVYMYKDNDGYKVDTISAQDATIIYDNEPRIVKQTGEFKNWYSWIYAIPAVKTKNYIYVPKGSIQEEYDIDLRE